MEWQYITLLMFIYLHGKSESKQPNVLFLVIDDLRAALGSYDFPKVLSPNIDQLALHSVQFSNAHVQQTVCGPSRTSFLTSRRPDTTRLYDFGSYWRKHAGNFTTLPQHFKQNGYFTYSIGKVFHPGIPSNYNDDYPLSWSKPAYHPSTEKYSMSKVCPGPDGKKHMNLLCPVDVSSQPGGSLPDIQSADHAVEMLKNFSAGVYGDGQPFFLAVGFHKPHIPYKFPRRYLDLYPLDTIDLAPNPVVPVRMPDVAYSSWPRLLIRDDVKPLNLSFPFGPIPSSFQRKIRQHYFSSVTYTDALVGKVLQQLEESGLSDNTIVTLIGDHGWSLGEHGDWCKYENFEVVTRVPLLVYVPRRTDVMRKGKHRFPFIDVFNDRKHSTERGPQSRALVEAVDLFPSLAQLTGLQVPPTCPDQPFNVEFCTEGASFVNQLHTSVQQRVSTDILRGIPYSLPEGKSAVFSQYPRPSEYPQMDTDLPSLRNIRIMGYTMRTHHHRYTEWVGFDPTTFRANFTDVRARELYLHDSDPLEIYNVADMGEYEPLVTRLRHQLVAGWRAALPPC